ncbi:MAG: hypothetical protein M3313_15785 [Actinomycetota bacterium]|nr:hypothetical protein [Actinomycetota bacterium]
MAEVPLPDRLAGAVGMHVIGHLRPEDRRALWSGLAARLAPGAPVVYRPPSRSARPSGG